MVNSSWFRIPITSRRNPRFIREGFTPLEPRAHEIGRFIVIYGKSMCDFGFRLACRSGRRESKGVSCGFTQVMLAKNSMRAVVAAIHFRIHETVT